MRVPGHIAPDAALRQVMANMGTDSMIQAMAKPEGTGIEIS